MSVWQKKFGKGSSGTQGTVHVQFRNIGSLSGQARNYQQNSYKSQFDLLRSFQVKGHQFLFTEYKESFPSLCGRICLCVCVCVWGGGGAYNITYTVHNYNHLLQIN